MVYQGYDREDGLWDIEAELTDVKTYGFQVPNERPFPANEPIHHLKIRVTLDNKMVIQDIATLERLYISFDIHFVAFFLQISPKFLSHQTSHSLS